MSVSILQFQFFWEIEEMLQGKSQTNTNDIELLVNVKKGCVANTTYSELHVKTMMKMAVKKRLEIELTFGDSNFILP